MAAGEDSVMLATAPPHVKREHEPSAHEPINLKSEVPEPEKHCLELTPVCYESEEDSCSSSVPSPRDQTMGVPMNDGIMNNRIQHDNNQDNNSPQHSTNNNLPLPHQDIKPLHLNGALSGMVNLHNLQNLTGLPTAQPAVPPMAASQLINTPLNLSINATGPLSMAGMVGSPPQPPQLLAAPQPAAMPQFILASGQLVQGIQGAQLLIPTSQGIATQTILTIPVNHVTSNQMVNLALSNGQVITTTLANLQTMAQPHHLLAPTHNTVPCTSPNMGAPGMNSHLPHQLLSNGHQQQQLINALQQQQQQQQQQQHQQQQQQQQHQQQHTASHQNNHSQKSPLQHHNHNQYSSSVEKSPPHSGTNGIMSNGAITSSSASSSPLNTINRLAANNSDLTITTTSGSKQASGYPHNNNNNNNNNNNMQHSPGLDLLDDSPNQPTISQSNCNMVDGINLDEIKEFAKAFKLRRLSLGLTQTQVGQALSITEGPAYSQSAICSALATQMYCAAQLASQQHYMFEKLDITPKSAQKIKPVLERWMKEAEERAQYPQPMPVDSDAPRGLPEMYKSGQNHLTEFIGVEPSKKRKRRTSFTPQALELLNAHFERNTHPSGTEITTLAHQLGYEREVIRIWFCNKRQALKNTVRMMSKSCTPPHLGGSNHLTT